MDNEERKLVIKATGDDPKGRYSNSAIITHTKNEFALDFLIDIAGQKILISRIITSPEHAKALSKALQKNISDYEKKVRTIDDDYSL